MTADDRDLRSASARQLLHAATGDRDAEADALAEESDADPEDAKLAVQRAHGDATDRPKTESDLASPADVHTAEDDTAEGEAADDAGR